MRNAIDMMELAMMGWPELVELPEKWGEPRHCPDVKVSSSRNHRTDIQNLRAAGPAHPRHRAPPRPRQGLDPQDPRRPQGR